MTNFLFLMCCNNKGCILFLYTWARDGLGQSEDADVIVDGDAAVVLVEDSLGGGHHDAAGLVHVVEVEGTGVNFPRAET